MGKQIRIYLADNSPSGIKHAEITNWTGQALACPRSRFQDLRYWQEVKRPGVYFLFGHDDETGDDSVYIGEAEIVAERLASHINGKDFWTELVTFTSKDDNLTKGHIRYLESRLIQQAIQAGRYKVMNSAEPQLPSLPRADRDAMEEYLDSAKTLLGVLGHRLLDSLVSVARNDSVKVDTSFSIPEIDPVPAKNSPTAAFRLNIGNLTAYAIRTDEGIVVLKESEAAMDVQSSLSGGQRNIREALIKQEVLVPNGSKFKFSKNHLFNSASQAASLVVGYSINGRDAWRLPDGTTFAKYELGISEQLLQELESSS